MAFNYNWEYVRPIRTEWRSSSDGSYGCFSLGTVWGKGTTGDGYRRDRDRFSASSVCGPSSGGPGSTEFCSRNNATGQGNAVMKIQGLLNNALIKAGYPYPLLTGDGVIGTKTHDVIKWYQGRKGLKADGLVGLATWSKLRYE